MPINRGNRKARYMSAAREEFEREARRRTPGLLTDSSTAHTHLFPPGFFRAICGWFDEHAWRIRFRATPKGALEELGAAG